MKEKKLKPLNSTIQVCPYCGKVDAYKGDKHDCQYERIKQERQESES
jgi:hypothetical protein